MKLILTILILLTGIFTISAQNKYYSFSNLPELPANSGYTIQPGLAGPYTGIDDDVLIVAGGANFPAKLPWEGGTKVYYNEIFVLQKQVEDEYKWISMEQKLPFTSAYGGAISTSNGLLCFGGNSADNCISKTWFIDYLSETGTVEVVSGPTLPTPLTNFAFSEVDNVIYIAGGISAFG